MDLWVGGTSKRPLARVFGCFASTIRRAQQSRAGFRAVLKTRFRKIDEARAF